LTTGHFDTCDCIIQFNDRVNWIATFQQCRLHKSLLGQNLLDTVIAQNQRFNQVFGDGVLTEEEDTIIILSKQVNRLRIKTENLDNFIEDLPDRPIEMNVGFWQNLRSLLPF